MRASWVASDQAPDGQRIATGTAVEPVASRAIAQNLEWIRMTDHLPDASANAVLEAQFRLAEKVWAARPDVRAACSDDLRSWDFWFWFLWHGTKDHEEVRQVLFPQPPEHLLHRVVGGMSPREYLESGLVDARRMVLSFEEAGLHLDEGGGRVLDFGCGCGRLIQCMARYAAGNRFAAVDVDDEAIQWCSKNLDFAEFRAVATTPPLPFEPSSFDAVYSFSVFSHLPEERSRAWLAELARVTRPGAVLVLTIMGEKCIEAYGKGREGERPTPEELARDVDALRAYGFRFFPYQTLETQVESTREYHGKLDLDQYGSTFILERYVRRHWTGDFDLVSHQPAPDGWQDYVVLRRKG